MAVLDRIDTGYTAWTPSTAGIATEDELYEGKHRRSGGIRRLSLLAMFYSAKHAVTPAAKQGPAHSA